MNHIPPPVLCGGPLLPGRPVGTDGQRHEEWAAQVWADQAFWQRRGATVHGVGTDFGRCVTVGLADPQRDGAKVLAHYSKAALCVEQGYASDPLTAS
ncbi:hypothetical protein [Micromonospora matsumotoense]|uniref:hypothetical protein n=1 Tax=Micromonospora matsumotoense TaxID=121616 RepID=UPI0033EB5575